jgi:DNA-binding PadR family transcriptional regulator
VADKLAQYILDALSKAAAEPGGLPLLATKSEPGLFPSTAAAKPASQKCLSEGLIQLSRTEARGKSARELYTITDAGWDYLLEAVNPKQVLEDFVRVLEARQGEVGELLDRARHMADVLGGIRDAVSRVLPRVAAGRPAHPDSGNTELHRASPFRSTTMSLNGSGGTALLETPAEADLGSAILTRLDDWSSLANAGEDCPLPELFRSLAAGSSATIGEFHDTLRQLHSAGAIYLHPWTGPLHEMPEPAYALLVGHNIAYYASQRGAGARNQESEVRRTG